MQSSDSQFQGRQAGQLLGGQTLATEWFRDRLPGSSSEKDQSLGRLQAESYKGIRQKSQLFEWDTGGECILMKRQHPLVRRGTLSEGENSKKGDNAESQNLKLCFLSLNST